MFKYYEPEYTPDEPQVDSMYERHDGVLVRVEVSDDVDDD